MTTQAYLLHAEKERQLESLFFIHKQRTEEQLESLFFVHEFQQCDPRFCPFCNRLTKPIRNNHRLAKAESEPIAIKEWSVNPDELRFK